MRCYRSVFRSCDHATKHLQHQINFFQRDIQRRHKSQQIWSRRIEQQPGGVNVARDLHNLAADWRAQLQRTQQAFAALTFETVFLAQLEQTFTQIRTLIQHRLQKAGFEQLFQHRDTPPPS